MRSSVDLPEPEGPSSATISPGSMDRSVGAITCTLPPSGRSKDFSICRASMMGGSVGAGPAASTSRRGFHFRLGELLFG